MKKIEIRNKFTGRILVSGKYENSKDCVEKNTDKNLSYADLLYANLFEANLSYANLSRATLSGANLSGAKSYCNSHAFFQEIIRREKSKLFNEKEWSIIGQIIIHQLCWDTIKKRYGKDFLGIAQKLADKGWEEFYEHYKNL